MQTKTVLILTAVQMEARALRQAVKNFGCKFHTVGISAVHLPNPSQLADISLILLCGVAGGLDPALKVGEVVLDDSNLFPVPVRHGQIYTASRIIATPAEKADLFARTGALAVDMEQATVKVLADQNHIPLVGVRAISDTADQTLNPTVIGFVDELGRPKPAKIAMGLLKQPFLIPYLARLNKNTKYALLELSRAVETILTSIEKGSSP